jgi:ABC-2 type transport system ATP-binding protein
MARASTADDAIVVKNLYKSYKDFKVLKGVSFAVKRGSILALLGPNGAGKTTTIKVLSTLLKSDKGTATINGFDVDTQEAHVRSSIGLTGQYAAVDEYLTGKENLELVGRLYRMRRADAAAQAKRLLKEFDLEEAGNRPVKQYSGGMRRRLDLAMSLIASPPIIFLDEPTTGLDPRSRLTMWGMIQKLANSGTTILLTTQYMEEADHLADNIIVIDGGKVIAEGTSDELKRQVGSDRLVLTISRKSSFSKAKEVVDGKGLQANDDERQISVATKYGVKDMTAVLQKLEAAKIEVENASLHRPTLDDVFLTLTGHSTDNTTVEEAK